jgi:hypothetical protein
MRHSFARCEELPSTEPTTTSPYVRGIQPGGRHGGAKQRREQIVRGRVLEAALARARDGRAKRGDHHHVVGGLGGDLASEREREGARGWGGGGARVSGKHEAGC